MGIIDQLERLAERFPDMSLWDRLMNINGYWLWYDVKASLNYMWQGMLAIFIVIGVIILSVYAVGYITDKIEKAKVAKADAEEQKTITDK